MMSRKQYERAVKTGYETRESKKEVKDDDRKKKKTRN